MNSEESRAGTILYFKSIAKDFALDAVVLLYLLGVGLSALPIKSFEFSKACLVDLNITRISCEDIVYRSKVAGHEEDYSKVEKLFTSTEVWMEVVRNAVPACLILFTGAFSDKIGRRKFFILLPVAFEILSYLGLIIADFNFYGSGLIAVGLIRCLPGFSGGTAIMLMAVFSHIGDVTDEKSRTGRIGRLTVVVLACQPVAYLLTPLVVIPGKTYPALFSSLVLFIVSLVVGYILIEDRDPKAIPERPLIVFFKPDSIADAIKLMFKSRPGNLKKIVICVTLISILSTAIGSGENKVVYQYLKRTFALDDKAMSYYITFSIIILFLGTALMVNIFVKKCHLEDHIVGLVGNVNKLIVNTGYAFIKTPTALYIVTFFDAFTGCASIGMRSIASKSVASEELGKLFSIFGFIDLATPPLSAIIYGAFYTLTREKLTGAFFLLSYIFILPVCALFVSIKVLQKRGNDIGSEIDQVNGNQIPSEELTNGIVNENFDETHLTKKSIEDIRL